MTKQDEILRITEKLNELKLHDMASALEELFSSSDFDSIGRIDFLERIIDPEYESQTDKSYRNRIKKGNLKGVQQTIDSCCDSAERKYFPPGIVSTLASMNFIKNGLNVCILGPSDSGKSYLAKALGVQTCLKYRTSYHHCEQFIDELVSLKSNDYKEYKKRVNFFVNLDLLILDDFLLHSITEEIESKVLVEVLEKRIELSRSTIVCSQREPNSWSNMILSGDAVPANAIMKRVTKHLTVVIEPSE